jgi:ElaB/YqjD/DUF883 family membrane-anchored ribosome-binding protein
MNQHVPPRGSLSETGRPESYGEMAEGAVEGRAQSRIGAASEGVRAGQREAAKVMAHSRSRLGDDISQYVRNQPLTALVIAAGLGYLIGRRAWPRRPVAALSHVAGVQWPPPFETPRSPEAGVQFPPRQP